MTNVLPFAASLLLLSTGLLAQECPNGVKKQVTFSIACGPSFPPEDFALVSDAILEVDVVAAHPHLGPRGGVMTRYDVEAVNVFKGPSALQKGTKFSLDRYGGVLQSDCRLMDWYTNEPRFNPGERWLLMLHENRSGELEVSGNDQMWKVNGDEVQRFDPEKRRSRQEVISKIGTSLESTNPLTWDQVHSIAALGTPEKVVPIIRQRGVDFVMSPEMRQEIWIDGKFGRAELVEAIETSPR